MKNNSQNHISVLLTESIDGLQIRKDGIYVDATLGRAGHSLEILKSLSNLGMLYAFDQDLEAIETSASILSTLSPRYELIHANYSNIKEELAKKNVNLVDGIIFDLGVSSPQLDNSERGFSYNTEARLDMRMNREQILDAHTVVNKYSEEKLVKLLFEYGEEKFAKRIAKNIVIQRSNKEIQTTLELVDIIRKSLPAASLREGHPAKRSFQAIRIEVNDELGSLEIALRKCLQILNKKGRIAVITFHSLEDRIVKKIFKEVSEAKSWNRHLPMELEEETVEFKLITRKPILPKNEELVKNRRSHSAKLRIIEKI